MSSTPENILHFRKCAMVVLNLLYESFPTAINIDAFYIEGEGEKTEHRVLNNYYDEMNSWEKYGLHDNPINKALLIYIYTIAFLRNEGYIKCNESNEKAPRVFYDCVLTSKGLLSLGKVAIAQKISWGDLIHTTIRDGKYKAIQELAQKFLVDIFQS